MKERNLVEEKREEVHSSLKDNNQKQKRGLSPSTPMNKVLISSCLLGENVKYDGGNNSILEEKFIQKLQKSNLIVSVCPEVEGGLSTPRVPVEIQNTRAINKEGDDKTDEFNQGAVKTLKRAKQNGIKMAIMKSRSPSCGKDKIYDGSFSKTLIKDSGITAKLLKAHAIKIFTENELKEAYDFWKSL